MKATEVITALPSAPAPQPAAPLNRFFVTLARRSVPAHPIFGSLRSHALLWKLVGPEGNRTHNPAASPLRSRYRQSPQLTRNSSGDEIANVKFLYDDIVDALHYTIDLCINSATDRRSYVLERRFTKFSKITQCNSHYAIQGHSRSPILVPIESSYDFVLVINTNLPPILHRFQVMADY